MAKRTTPQPQPAPALPHGTLYGAPTVRAAPIINGEPAPPPWAPTLGEAVGIKPLNGTAGTVEAIQERIGNATLYAVNYVNGVGTRIEDWFRADQLSPSV